MIQSLPTPVDNQLSMFSVCRGVVGVKYSV
jgi:hypothetical protein